jgi:hypothetical protein
MRRAVLPALLFSVIVACLASGADRVAVERILTDPQTPAAASAASTLMEQVAALASRLFGPAISVTTAAPSTGDAYTLSVYQTTKADAPMVSLTLTSTADTGRSLAYSYFGPVTPDVPTVLARALYLLWANLDGKLDANMTDPPVVVEELPTDLLGANTYPMALSVTPQGTVVAALGLACVELDHTFGLVRRIGTGLYDGGLYALAYGVSTTPAGTVYLKPGTGRDVYKLSPGAADPQRVSLGVDMTTTSVVALSDGSLFLLDTAKKTALRVQGRQRQDLKVFSSQYTYISTAAAAPDGSLWIYDQLMKGIRIYTAEGNPVDSLLPLVDLNAPLTPTSLSVGPDGSFVVFSYGQVVRFRRDGSVAWRLTSLKGADDEALPLSGSVAMDWSHGIVYVADMTGKRIVKLLDVAWCREHGITNAFEAGLLGLRARKATDEVGSLTDTARMYDAAGVRLMARAYWQKLQDADPGNETAAARIGALDVAELTAAARELDLKARSTLAAIGLETARPISVQALQKYELVLSKAPGDDQTRRAMEDLRSLFSDAGAVPQKKPPLAITDVKLDGLFPSLMQWYATHAAGSLTVKSPLADAARNVRASLFIPRFMDLPSESKPVASLAPGGSVVIPLSPAFSQAVLELQEDMLVQAQVSVTWGPAGAEQTVTRTVNVTLHRNSALTWDDTRKISSFITPNDAVVSGFAARTLAAAGTAPPVSFSVKILQAMRISDAVGTYGIAYVQDPDSPIALVLGNAQAVDTVRFPRTTLFNRTGDCDDTTALFCSLLESQGIRTAVLTTPGHIFMAFDTGEPSQNAQYFAGAGLEVLSRDGSAWIPVETTVLSQGFMTAWASASALVRKYAKAGPFEMLPLRDMRDSFPALPLPESSLSVVEPARSAVDGAFATSFAGFTAALYTNRVKDMEASLATLAPAQAVRLRVQEGVLHALFGRTVDAEAAFRAAMKQDPSLVSPYVNLANLRLLSRDPDGALAIVKQGLARNRDSALLNLVAGRIYADKGDQKDASVYFAAVRKASPDLADRYENQAGGAARAGNADEVPSVVWGADQ